MTMFISEFRKNEINMPVFLLEGRNYLITSNEKEIKLLKITIFVE